MKSLFSAVLFSVLFSLTVNAGPVLVTEVEKVRIRPSIAFIKFKDCHTYTRVRFNSEYEKAMITTALTAAAAGKRVQVEFTLEDPCSTEESELLYLEVLF